MAPVDYSITENVYNTAVSKLDDYFFAFCTSLRSKNLSWELLVLIFKSYKFQSF